MLGLYVDDHIFGGSTVEAVAQFNAYLSGTFKMKQLGVINGGFFWFRQQSS